ncbi:MAG: Bax inhibitor-1 family protein, partial [Deltaproteobacteria bacterium]
MQELSSTRPRTEVLVNDFVRSVYNWMGIGLALTAFIAFYVSSSESMMRFIFGNRMIFFVLLFAELGLVFAIGGMINRISAGTAT